MAVNSYLICEMLDSYVTKKLQRCTTECRIKYAMIYNPQIPMKSDTAYIVVDIEQFPVEKQEDKCLLITLGKLEEQVLKSTVHDVICVDKEYGLGRLYENIHEIFEYYNSWEEKMGNLLMQGCTLNELCSISVPYFQNPLTVQEENYEIIGVGETEEIAYPYDFRERGTDYLAETWINSALKKEKEVFGRKGPFEFNYVKEHSSLLYNIFQDEKYIAQICIDANHQKFVMQDYIRICILAKYVKQYLKYNVSRQSGTKNRFRLQLLQFINGDDTKAVLEVSLAKNHWSEKDQYICCAITKLQDETKSMSLDYFCHRWETQIPRSICFGENSNIYLLINIGKSKKLEEAMREKLEQLAGENKSQIGISEVFVDFFKCRNYYEQAKAALRLGEEFMKNEKVIEFAANCLDYVIKYGTHAMPIDVFVPKGLKQLMLYDKSTDSELCKTLQVYLQNNLNVTETGNALFLHRSTLKYRIQRIKEIMESELEDYKEQIYLQILLFELL